MKRAFIFSMGVSLLLVTLQGCSEKGIWEGLFFSSPNEEHNVTQEEQIPSEDNSTLDPTIEVVEVIIID